MSFLRGQTRGSAFEENICSRCCIMSDSHLHCRVCQLGVLHDVKGLLRRFEIPRRNRKCSRDFRKRMEAEDGARDDSKRSQRAGH